MSVDRRLLNWGVFLVLLGGVPLAVAQGWIPRDAVARAWELWPFILIGAGIGLILGRTPLRALGGLIVAGTFGVILGGMLAVGVGGVSLGSIGCGSAAADAPVLAQEQGTFEGATGGVLLAANCAAVSVTAEPGNGWGITVRGTENSRPDVEKAAGLVKARSPERPVVVAFGTQQATWDATLGTATRLDLTLTLNAGDANVDLAGASLAELAFSGNAIGSSKLDLSAATVDRLDVTVNAGQVTVLLPASADLRGDVQANAASVGLCAATGVGLRLLVDDNITASNNYDDQGLVRTGNAWETPGYAGATSQIELRTTGSAVSFTLNPKDGCR